MEVGDGAPQEIKVKEFSESDAGLCIVASASHNTPETEAFIAKVRCGVDHTTTHRNTTRAG